MARKFKKRADLGMVFVPGVGHVRNDQVLEGDQWARFCPSLLVEVLDQDREPTVKVKSSPPPKAAPPPPPPPAPEPEPEPEPEEPLTDEEVVEQLPTEFDDSEEAPEEDEPEEDEEEEEPPSMSWRKAELVDYAEGLDLNVKGMTKAEILEAIAEAEAED
jgi:hypothetical protein